jgi:Mg/Co/Ni transporter MgtE
MTTCVDSTGLVIYFFIAQLVLGIKGHPAHG